MALSKDTIASIIGFCNRDLVPDQTFDSENQYHNEWFVSYFDFLAEPSVESQLGDAFYQARFMYKLMNALNLPLAKQKGIVKFQIVQYASICEAVLDMAIMKYFKEDAEETLSVLELVKYPNAVSKDTKITCGETPLVLCQTKKKKGDLKRTRVDFKTKYAVSKGLISQSTKDLVDNLYDLRNNIHILKAANSQYTPKLREAKDAFLLMQSFVGEIKNYYTTHPTT
jgi:hypothetical protein